LEEKRLKKGNIFQLDLTKFFDLNINEQTKFKEIPINDFIHKIYQIKNLDLLDSPMISTITVNQKLLDQLYFTVYYSGTRTSTPKMIQDMSLQSKEFWDIYSLTFDFTNNGSVLADAAPFFAISIFLF